MISWDLMSRSWDIVVLDIYIYIYILYNYTWSFFMPHLMGISGVVRFFRLYKWPFFAGKRMTKKNWKKIGGTVAWFQTNCGEPRAVSSYH